MFLQTVKSNVRQWTKLLKEMNTNEKLNVEN